MKLTFLCLGSRGDVQPYVALGAGFQNAGYQVRIATHDIFQDLVIRHGLEFAPVQGDPREMLDLDAMKAALKSGTNMLAMIVRFREVSKALLDKMLDSAIAACGGSDALLYGLMGIPAYHLADYWKIPRFPMLLQPVTRTGAFPSIGFPEWNLGAMYNRLSWLLGEQAFGIMLTSLANEWRHKKLNLPRMHSNELYLRKVPYTYGFSEHVIPRPGDYPEWHRIAGYWFLDQTPGWTPPSDLADFINAGSKPVYIGFGSMNAGESQRITKIVIDALARNRQRGILLRGWGGLHAEALPETIRIIDSVPHEWLFPQMSVIVHHGGAGTTSAAFRSGVPQVVVPHFADQPFWASRAYSLGVAAKPLNMNRLNAADLARAIDSVLDNKGMTGRAQSLGSKIQMEHGIEKSVEIVSAYLKKGTPYAD